MTQSFRFCPNCGAALQGRFCSACGSDASHPKPGGQSSGLALVPYLLGGAVVVALLSALFLSDRGTVTAPAPESPLGPAAGAPPDLSTMSPRERFDRLFERIMTASESGDKATVATFSPMAMAAYSMLESVDADARFHAAMIRLATGDGPGATALADTIQSQQPGHLFAILIKGSLARLDRNQDALKAAQREFLAAYPAEIASGRPEYPGHQVLIDRFLKEAKP